MTCSKQLDRYPYVVRDEKNNAWALYSHKALEENFDMRVYVNIVLWLVQGDAVTTMERLDQHVMHEEDRGHVRERSSGKEGARVDPSKVDAWCMDDEVGGSGDEEAADNNDSVPAIQYFRGVGLLDFAVAQYNTLSN